MSDRHPEAAPPTAEELRQVIHIVEDLTAVMSREVELLRAMRVRDFGELQDHKLGLVQAYEKQTEHLRTNPAFAATQFALFTALASLPRTLVSASTGFIAQSIGWTNFFLLCTALAIPGMLLLLKVAPWNADD